MTDSKVLIKEFIDAVVQNPSRARELLSKNPALKDARWIHNETVLHFLAVEGFTQAVSLLIELGFDVNAINEFGNSVLIEVISIRHYEIVEILLKAGARTDIESPTRGLPLECARENRDSKMETLLILYGAK